MNTPAILLWAAVAVLVLTVVGVFGAMVTMGKISFGDAQPVATADPTPQVPGVVDTSYTVLVLNASGEVGLENQVRDQLLANGWVASQVFAGPGGGSIFDTTTVYFVLAEDEGAARGVADLIGGASVEQSDFYADPDNAGQRQLTVVIGSDRANSQG